jgi:hypothetical protein
MRNAMPRDCATTHTPTHRIALDSLTSSCSACSLLSTSNTMYILMSAVYVVNHQQPLHAVTSFSCLCLTVFWIPASASKQRSKLGLRWKQQQICHHQHHAPQVQLSAPPYPPRILPHPTNEGEPQAHDTGDHGLHPMWERLFELFHVLAHSANQITHETSHMP